MTYTETCSCGASVTVSGWGLREVDLDAWVQKHARCIARPQPSRPTTTRPNPGIPEKRPA